MEILREREVEEVTQVSPNVAMQILTLAQDESRAELIELCARLLANVLDPLRGNVRQLFIDTVKQMDPQDAMIHDGPATFNGTTIPVLASEINTNDDSIFVALDHLKSLGVLAYSRSRSLWKTTPFGREFLRACYRYQ